jgi:hypothetical protein
MVTVGSDPSSSEYTYLGTPTAWDSGADTARVGGFPAPGGATWSIMGGGIADVSGSDAHGGSSTSLMTSLPGLAGITLAGMANVMNDALNTWANASGFTNLGQVADSGAGFGASDALGGNVGDIRIGSIFIDGAVGGNVLAHAYQPGTDNIFGAGGNINGDMHFDDSNSWFISDLNGSSFGTGSVDLLTVAIHELGHALGLGHSTAVGSIMEPIYAGPRTTLEADDIAGIQSIYIGSTTVVPIPASLWLFASGLLGLIGVVRKNHG